MCSSSSAHSLSAPVFHFVGSSIAGFTSSNPSGVSFTTNQCGASNSAVSLSGSAILTYTGSTSAVPAGSASKSTIVWVKCSVGTTQGTPLLVGYASSPPNLGLFSTVIENNRAYFWGQMMDTYGGMTSICDGSWHHIAMSYANPTVSVYVDGALANTLTAGALALPSDPVVALGTDMYRGPFSGSISDARIYDYALSASEIASDFTACPATATSTATATTSRTSTATRWV